MRCTSQAINTMLAVEYHSNDDVRIVDLPIPEIGAGELLVQLQACGLCCQRRNGMVYETARSRSILDMNPWASLQPLVKEYSISPLANESSSITMSLVWFATTASEVLFRNAQLFVQHACIPVDWPNIFACQRSMYN